MPLNPCSPPEYERSLGLKYYATSSPGMGGQLRQRPEDFLVEEVYPEVEYEGGRYLVLEVEKSGWESHHLVREMARALGISQKRFSWAGTKDKRALTRQRLCIMNLEAEALVRLRLAEVKIRVLGRTNRAVGLGDLLGNRFTVRIRGINLPLDELESRLERIVKEIEAMGGLPNYFGVQRFGDVRPVTHLIGEALVRGDPKRAVFTYLAKAFPLEHPETSKWRHELWASQDIEKSLQSCPSHLAFELAMLNYLLQHPEDYFGAFHVLAPNLRLLFVHAYQSYLFNCMLSRRLQEGLPLSQAVVGDVVCFTKGQLPDVSRLEQVTEDNLEAVSRLALRGRAFVTLPLVGSETVLAQGAQGEIEREVMDEEAITPQDFSISSDPELGSPGTRRAILLPVKPEFWVEDRDAVLKFFLPKGSYATVVLREFVKGPHP